MKNILILLLLSFIVSTSYSQTKEEKNEKTKQLITQLKDGCLFVRLATSKIKIEALKNAGKSELAEKVEKEQYLENLEIMNAFKNHYTFGKVYFIYSDASEKVMMSNIDSICLNEKLEVDYSISPSCKTVFTAQIGQIYNTTFGSDIIGLGLMDDQFKPLPTYFPGYVSKRDLIFFKRSANKMVRMLNTKLEETYTKYSQK